jgi:nucleoside-diphosphate-sugar epimerase
MNVCILGGNGLIGRELVRATEPFLVLDNEMEENIDKNYFKSTADNVEEFCRIAGKKPDVIYLLTNSVKNFGNSVNTFIVVANYAKKVNAKLVYLSNVSVYNHFTVENMDENPVTLEGEFFYSIDRIAKFYRQYIKIVGFRLFSVYGDNFGYPYLLTQKKKNIKTSKCKDLISIKDCIRALISAATVGNDVFNLGTEYSTNLTKLGKITEAGDSIEADMLNFCTLFGYIPEKFVIK